MTRAADSDADVDHAQFPKETDSSGAFRRQPSHFHNRVTAEGHSGFRAEAERYHLYVSYACPWAHRTIIVRKLKKLEEAIGLTVVDPIRDERGWAFTDEADPVGGFRYLREAYVATDPTHEGRVTVPVLWDKLKGVIVNNESAEIIRMLNSEFDAWGDSTVDLCPESLREDIDAINAKVYETVNNGVYRAGFATTQGAYEQAVRALFPWAEAKVFRRPLHRASIARGSASAQSGVPRGLPSSGSAPRRDRGHRRKPQCNR